MLCLLVDYWPVDYWPVDYWPVDYWPVGEACILIKSETKFKEGQNSRTQLITYLKRTDPFSFF